MPAATVAVRVTCCASADPTSVVAVVDAAIVTVLSGEVDSAYRSLRLGTNFAVKTWAPRARSVTVNVGDGDELLRKSSPTTVAPS